MWRKPHDIFESLKKERKKKNTHYKKEHTEVTLSHTSHNSHQEKFYDNNLYMSQFRPCLLAKLWSISHGDGPLLLKHYAKSIRTISSFTQSPSYTHTQREREGQRIDIFLLELTRDTIGMFLCVCVLVEYIEKKNGLFLFVISFKIDSFFLLYVSPISV